jgi:site-specific DNA-methyltransferase (adenine-specific)
LNTDSLFRREDRGLYILREAPAQYALKVQNEIPTKAYSFGRSRLFEADCISWLQQQPEHSIHALVTDPPYGLVEYTSTEQEKLRIGKGGIWRIPPSFDGTKRSPLPRFTVLSTDDLEALAGAGPGRLAR